ncbi:MAG TPA: hypothetical protein VMU81_15745 [Acetobacteraceae bacterium]|nr:hypothetical protein [Acetobacteraceae bacterium]
MPAVLIEERVRLFGLALEAAEREETLVNMLIEAHADGTVEVGNWAKDTGGDAT